MCAAGRQVAIDFRAMDGGARSESASTAMSLLISRPRNISATAEDSVSQEGLRELQETIARLQLLVCELLVENQTPRFQEANE